MGATGAHVGVLRRFIHGERWRETDVTSGGALHPFVAPTGLEDCGETFPHCAPGAAIILVGQVGGLQLHASEQVRVEMRFDRANRDILAVGRLIAAIKGRAAVDDVVRPLIRPCALLAERLKGRHQMGHPIDHRDVESLALSRLSRVEHGRKNPHRQVERASAKVGDEIERRRRGAVGLSERVKRAGQREIVDVVSGLLSERTLLSPSGHAGEDEPWVGGETDLGPEAQPLHDAGPKAFDKRIGLGDRGEDRTDGAALLQVERHRSFVSIVEVEPRRRFGVDSRLGNTVDAQNVCAEIAEQAPSEGRRSDPT